MDDELKYLGPVPAVKRASVMRDTKHEGIMLLVVETEDGSSHYYTMTEEIAAALSQTITDGPHAPHNKAAQIDRPDA